MKVVCLLTTAAMLPFVIGRIIVRIHLRKRFGIDDWVIIAAAVRHYGEH
jgi:hypothetical protein